MITLVGTRHSHANENRDMLREIIRLNDYDHIFTEGLSSEAQSRSEDHVERFLEEKNMSEKEGRKLGRGPEPEFFEKSPLVDEESVTYLDDRDLGFLAETVLEEDGKEDKSREGEIISHSEFEQKLVEDETMEDDFLQYLTGLMVEDELRNRPKGTEILGGDQLDDKNIKYMNEQDLEMAYTAVSNSSRFQHYVEKVSERFASEAETEVLDMLDNVDDQPEKYRDRFLSGIEEHGIDRETLQQLLYKERGSFQDERDQNWYSQITEYIQENPRDDILIIAGIHHVLPEENTLRTQMEQKYPDTNVKPLDYQQN